MTFRTRIHNLPIEQKLVLLISVVTGLALVVYTLLSMFMQVQAMRLSMVENLSILARSMGFMSTAGLSFRDRVEIDEILATLKVDPSIEQAVIYDTLNRPFWAYLNPEYAVISILPQVVEAEVERFIRHGDDLKLEIFTPIYLDSQRIGTLYVIANSRRVSSHLRSSIGLLMLGMVIIFAAAGAVAHYLQGFITTPLLGLARTARVIARKGDYSLRAVKGGDDEIGYFIDDFNQMVQAVQDRDEALHQHHQNLERLVRERTEELRIKRDEALAAAKAKAEFLANMSHEIRTPMNGVIGVLSLLQEAPLTEEYRRLLATATRSADSLLLIINDILDFSKIDAGKISFETVPFELRNLVEETAQLFIDSVNVKVLELSCEIAVDVPYRLIGDPTRLRQVMTNLVSNALKFTEVGEVCIRVSVVGREEDRLDLRIDVIDTGIGIPATMVNRIFDKFVQADGSTGRKYGGTGLGLAVCRELVELQGGTISVESEEAKGSCFWFVLPFAVAEDALPELLCQGLNGRHYLLVGASETNSRVISSYLSLCGSQVTLCADGKDAQAAIAGLVEARVDAILVDHRPPSCDGPKLAERLRSWLGTGCPPIIALSSGSVFSGRVDSLPILLKPVSQEALYEVLGNVRNGMVATPLIQRSGELVPRRSRWLAGRVLLVDDEPINQKVLLAIMQRFGLLAEVAGSGREALEMIGRKKYDMVLMDVQMPGMNGLEATMEIRALEKRQDLPRVPIVAITANALGTARDLCLEAGMDDFITKPVKPEVLFERLAPWLAFDGNVMELASGQQADTAALEMQPQVVWNPQRALEFVGHDKRLLYELIGLFLKRYSTLVENVEKAVAEGDAGKLRDTAHAYKGTVTHFAAEESRQLASELEMLGKNGNLADAKALAEALQQSAVRLAAELREYIK